MSKQEYWVTKMQVVAPSAAIYDVVYWSKKGGNVEWITSYLARDIAYIETSFTATVRQLFERDI